MVLLQNSRVSGVFLIKIRFYRICLQMFRFAGKVFINAVISSRLNQPLFQCHPHQFSRIGGIEFEHKAFSVTFDRFITEVHVVGYFAV